MYLKSPKSNTQEHTTPSETADKPLVDNDELHSPARVSNPTRPSQKNVRAVVATYSCINQEDVQCHYSQSLLRSSKSAFARFTPPELPSDASSERSSDFPDSVPETFMTTPREVSVNDDVIDTGYIQANDLLNRLKRAYKRRASRNKTPEKEPLVIPKTPSRVMLSHESSYNLASLQQSPALPGVCLAKLNLLDDVRSPSCEPINEC
jgi:hypothetical protein